MCAASLCVTDPKIEEVLDLTSGEILSAQDAIGSNYAALEQRRMRLAEAVAENRPVYACPICGVGVYIVCRRNGDDKRFHFRHRTEDGRCPAVTREPLTKAEIEARKYNGAKESQAHLRMKDIIAESLACDPEFSAIAIEQVWKASDRSAWRKPDVRALWRGAIPVAFEIQLSTTFLHVIAERRIFYRQQGGLLCWIFRTFDAGVARMTQDDVFFNNNQNLFLASERTLEASKEQHALVLDCHWAEPAEDDEDEVCDPWQGQFARFAELTLDLEQQRVFLFDYAGQYQRLQAQAVAEGLQGRFERWWAQWDWAPNDETWKSFRQEFKASGVILPEWPNEVRALLNALYSAKTGKAVGYRNPKFISVAHTIATSHKDLLQAFRADDRASQLRAEDTPEPGQQKGKWAKKVDAYKEQMRAGDSAYKRDPALDLLIALLFPDVWAQLQAWDVK